MRVARFLAATGCFILLSVTLAARPAAAQGGEGPSNVFPPGFLSDVTGPFVGHAPQLPPFVTLPPNMSAAGIYTPLPVWMAQTDIGATGTLLQDVVGFNAAMDKLLPFSGCCTNVNWKAYNNSIKAAKRLRQALSLAVAEQQKILASNPSPAQVEAVQKRLRAIEDTTASLERASQILVFLATSLDKAR